MGKKKFGQLTGNGKKDTAACIFKLPSSYGIAEGDDYNKTYEN